MTRPLSVLLAEDDDPLRSLLIELLDARGFVVHAAARGDEAFELAHRIRVDVSVLDFHLPGMTGVEVLRQLAGERRILPTILMSGEAHAEDVQAATAFGLVEFLRKPLDLERLRRSLDLLERAHRRLLRATGDANTLPTIEPRGEPDPGASPPPGRPGHPRQGGAGPLGRPYA